MHGLLHSNFYILGSEVDSFQLRALDIPLNIEDWGMKQLIKIYDSHSMPAICRAPYKFDWQYVLSCFSKMTPHIHKGRDRSQHPLNLVVFCLDRVSHKLNLAVFWSYYFDGLVNEIDKLLFSLFTAAFLFRLSPVNFQFDPVCSNVIYLILDLVILGDKVSTRYFSVDPKRLYKSAWPSVCPSLRM